MVPLDCVCRLTAVFDYPTPDILADHLRQEIARDGETLSGAALAEVGKLEKLVQSMAVANDGARANLALRVKALLSVLENGQDTPAGDAADSDLEAATAENIFDLLDKELGES